MLSADKPQLTDYDQAKVVLFKPKPEEPKPNLAGLECKITQTKITRVPYLAYKDEFSLGTDTSTGKKPPMPFVLFCDLSVTDAGGMRLDYTIREHAESNQPGPSTKDSATGKSKEGSDNATATSSRSILATDLVNDSIEVHTLYRFRVMAGPVHSSLSDRERTFVTKHHSGGNSFVGSDVTGNPINAVIFLKYYWQPRDVYDTKWCWDGKTDGYKLAMSCLGRINPIVGVNVSSNPLNSVYLGMSVDLLPGLDLVGGVHWASVEKLSGGFSQGQIVPNDTVLATEKRFLPGWFVGIAVDLGVASSWIGKTLTGTFK